MLDKAIRHGKEKRKEYYGSKRFDRSCRCHGSCSWCRGNRLFKHKRGEAIMEYLMTYNCTDEDYNDHENDNDVME